MKFKSALNCLLFGVVFTSAQVRAQTDPGEIEMTAEFLLYLAEFHDESGEWTDPETLQLLLEAKSNTAGEAKGREKGEAEIQPVKTKEKP